MRINKLIFISVLFVLVQLLFSSVFTEKTCAQTKWGGCAGAEGQCPGTSGPISSCVTSADFKVIIDGTGFSSGQTFQIDIYPTSGGNSCSDVKCLKRVMSRVVTWAGSPITVNLNQIGCSPGACPNSYNVNAYMINSTSSGTCTVDPSSGIFNYTIANGFSRSSTFIFTCSTSATSTPVPTATIGPTATPVPTTTIIPTATPTPTPALCGVGCTDNPSKCGDIPNCNYCNPTTHICTAPPPVVTPTATPTPNPFNTAMCKCDNITLEPASFVAGQKVNVVAYSKVEGGDLSYATIPTMIFNSERYTDPQHGIRDMPLDVSIGTTIVEQSATKIRYKATWSYTIPANPDPKVVYKVRSVPQCVQKTAGIQSSSRVADTTAPVTVSANKNIFSQIIDFILNIFGKKSTSKIQSSDTIQLDVLKMGEISGTDHCTYIEFQVK